MYMSDIEYSVITSDVIKSFDCIIGCNSHILKLVGPLEAIPIKYGSI